jgi:hypothetical protein
MDSLFALRALVAGTSQNAPPAVSESPSGIVGWEDGWGIELSALNKSACPVCHRRQIFKQYNGPIRAKVCHFQENYPIISRE